jgi:ketosteroid isomerase-like protein
MCWPELPHNQKEAIMPNNVDIAKQLFDACMSKDFEKVRSLLHPQYTLKDPMFELKGPDALIEMISNCPFDNKIENMQIIDGGDTVVSTFDCIAEKPVKSTMRMCDILKIEGGKVRSEEMFYDSAKIPQEVRDMMKQSMPGSKKAA